MMKIDVIMKPFVCLGTCILFFGCGIAVTAVGGGGFADGTPNVWVMNADGSDPKLLHAGDYPTLSPDGKKIACDDLTTVNQISLMDVDGRNNTPILIGKFPAWKK